SARLLKADLLVRMAKERQAIDSVRLWDGQLRSLSPELYVEYEQTIACALVQQGEMTLARLHYARAQRICDAIKNEPIERELVRRWEEQVSKRSVHTSDGS